jgi:hypothetical protein
MRFLFTVCCLFALTLPAAAQTKEVPQAPGGGVKVGGSQKPGAGPVLTSVATPEEVLAEVNAQRAKRGLRPFLLDLKLSEAAFNCAVFRAYNRIEGHTSNDFAYLPQGAKANCAGCAAWPQGMGFGACELYSNFRYAGVAFCIGRDGKRYCHAFYHN